MSNWVDLLEKKNVDLRTKTMGEIHNSTQLDNSWVHLLKYSFNYSLYIQMYQTIQAPPTTTWKSC